MMVTTVLIATTVTMETKVIITMKVTIALTVLTTRTVTTVLTTTAAPMAIAGFSLQDKQEKVWFFQETFFLDGRHQNRDGLVLGMPFLTLSCADIRFAESLSIGLTQLKATKRVKLFSAKEFAATALGADDEAFVVWSRRPRMFILLAKHKLPR